MYSINTTHSYMLISLRPPRYQKDPLCFMGSQENDEKAEFIEGKVDWRGRKVMKSKHGGMRHASFLLGSFTFEEMATLALAVNLLSYFHGVMHFDIPDTANHLTNFMGTSYILTLFVAFFADTYVGRFRSLLIAAIVEFLGLGLLALQAHYRKFKPSICNMYDPQANCVQVSGANAAFLFMGLYLIALGAGGVKATLPSLGADQFEDTDPREAKQKSSFFNFLLLALCLGGAMSVTFIVWIEDHNGWDLGLGVSTLLMLFSIILLVAGLPWYRIHVPNGSSAITKILQVYVAAIHNRKLYLPEDPNELFEINKDKEAASILTEFLPHTCAYRFMDKAAIQTSEAQNSGTLNPWKLCTVTQVENAKILLNMVPIFCCTIIMTLCLAQLQTFSIAQGYTMDTKITDTFSIPPASLPILPLLFLCILIPVYDQIIVPILRKSTGLPTGITHLQRVGVGLFLAVASMAVAGIVEVKRKNVAREHNMLDTIPLLMPPLPISVLWLLFQYFVFGIADMFTYVGLLEFFYSQVPQDLKSMSSCFLWTSMSLGYFFSTIIVKIVNGATKDITASRGWLVNNLNRGHLELFYWLLAILSLFNFCIYLFVSKRYTYRKENEVLELQVTKTRAVDQED